MSDNDPEATLLELAARQHGAFSFAQVLAAALPIATIQRRLQQRVWVTLHVGVYACVAATPTFPQRCWAALLWAGRDGVLSGRTAACLWKLDGLDREPDRIEISVPRALGLRSHAGLKVRNVRTLDVPDRAVIDGLAVTSLARTVVDLAGELRPMALEIALDSALRNGRVARLTVLWRANAVAKRGRKGARLLRALLAERQGLGATSASALETRMRRLTINSGLTPLVSQHRVHDLGKHVARPDFAYPDLKIAVEVDGYKFHAGRRSWAHDKRKRAELVARGWIVIEVSWEDVTGDPDGVARLIRQAIEQQRSRPLPAAPPQPAVSGGYPLRGPPRTLCGGLTPPPPKSR